MHLGGFEYLLHKKYIPNKCLGLLFPYPLNMGGFIRIPIENMLRTGEGGGWAFQVNPSGVVEVANFTFKNVAQILT